VFQTDLEMIGLALQKQGNRNEYKNDCDKDLGPRSVASGRDVSSELLNQFVAGQRRYA
jgi:hypothetical protein